jgi:hypothetical protein
MALVRYPTCAPPMASWFLDCKNCHEPFPYSQIPDTLAAYYLPSRPVFPAESRERQCPHCKTKSTSTLFDLRFQNSLTSRPVR